jgi:hypothetical protein
MVKRLALQESTAKSVEKFQAGEGRSPRKKAPGASCAGGLKRVTATG